MSAERILIIEDDEDIQELLRYNLKQEGFMVSGAISGEEGISKARSELPDLVLLDLMLPEVSGMDICKALKRNDRTRNILIIMITAKGEEADIVTGLEVGADDYIPKPFSPRQVVARVKAVLRRKPSPSWAEGTPVKHGEIEVDPQRHQALVRGQDVALTATEFKLLHFLGSRPGWVFTREQIVDAVRGEDYAVTERAVDVQVVGLRKKLGDCAHYIETVRGVGYRFRE